MRNTYYGDLKIEITVNRKELIERLRKNREKHQQEFEQAILLWQHDLAISIAQIDATRQVFFPKALERLQNNCPVSYLSEYDDLIDMFGMGVKDEILLEGEAFRKFCRDEWDWKSTLARNQYYKQVLRN
ncbi:MAG: hypothetical protein H7Y04_01340 [Verrucomicrobia bacterium]|nr:hypothetical protein [Cytophagales bacterium]